MSVFQRLYRGHSGQSASQEEVTELTNQFYVTLRAYFAKVKRDGEIRNQEAFNRVEELLKPGDIQNWTNAYEIEQLLVHLFEDDTLAMELSIRTLEARSVLSPELAAVYDAHVREIETLPETPQGSERTAILSEPRRTLLARLVNDLQWRYIVNEATRRYSKLITRRTAFLSVGALLAFTALVVFIYYRPLVFEYGDLRLLGVAGLAGAWGATFSMLVSLKGRLDASKFDDLKLMRDRWVLVSRALIGAGAACILFFFLLSGLLGGSAFPTLTQPPPASENLAPESQTSQVESRPTPAPARNLPPRDLALLIVWCFIAGFSEQLIPGLLATTEARANGAPASTSDRFRPTTGTAEVPPPPNDHRIGTGTRESQEVPPIKSKTDESKPGENPQN